MNSLELHFTEALNELSYFVIIPDRGFLKVNSVDTSALSLKHVIRSEESGALFWRIAKLYASNDSLREAKLKAALLELVILLADSFRSDEAALPQSKSLARMKIIISYINAHLEEHISADEVARAASLSKYHFLREFKKLTGMTLVSFINNLRCEKARSAPLVGRAFGVGGVLRVRIRQRVVFHARVPRERRHDPVGLPRYVPPVSRRHTYSAARFVNRPYGVTKQKGALL